MGLFRAATTFSVKDFTVSATTWLSISFRPFLQQAVFFVFNSFFPIMFRASKRVASSSSSPSSTSAASSSPAAGGMDVMEVTRPRSAAGPAMPPSRMQRKPKPQGPWPRDAGGQ